MRKLSKKISMLMVLAMLVSLFSGVVSASAASSWSFYNKTADVVVARNGNYEMENNEFADFDLFKDGKTVDTDTYAVKYESSDASVVFVDAKNGKLRAKGEAGEKATFTAVITNKNTKIVARRSFNITIVDEAEYAIVADFADEVVAVGEKLALAATVTADGEAVEAKVAFTLDGAAITEFVATEAGEYTIVATATVDGEVVDTKEFVVVAEAVVKEIAAKQTALNKVELTTSDATWAAAAVADNSLVEVAQVIDNVDIAELVKSVEAKKDAANVLVVTLYNNLAADKTYKFAYDGAEDSVVGAGSTPYRIEVVEKKIPVNQVGQAEIKVLNSANIDITTEEWKTAAEFSTDEDVICDVQQDGSIYFFETGKTIVVKAKFDMGYDEEGNELADLEAAGKYTSVEEFDYSKPNGYALSNQADTKNNELTYTTGTLKMSVSDNDENFRLVAKYTKTPYEGDAETLYIDNSEDDHSDADYTYKSTNESVLLVGETSGALQACKTGFASVYIKKGDTVVGSVSVQVEGARKLSSFSASIADKKLATEVGADTAKIVVTAKDQYTANYPASKVTYTLVLNTLKVGDTAVALDDFFTGFDADAKEAEIILTGDNENEFVLTLNADAADDVIEKIQTVSLSLKAKDTVNDIEKTYPLSVSIKNNTGYTGDRSRDLTLTASEMDIALSKKEFTDYQVKINLVELDGDKYDLGNAPIVLEEEATTGNPYSVVITKTGSDWNAAVDATDLITCDGETILIKTRTDAKNLETGTYKIQLFTLKGDKMQKSTPKYLTIKDSTPAVKAVVTKTNIDSESAIGGALEFYMNDTKINADDYIVSVAIDEDTKVAMDTKVYVKKVTVTLKNTVLNKDSLLDVTFTKDVDVNQLFSLPTP